MLAKLLILLFAIFSPLAAQIVDINCEPSCEVHQAPDLPEGSRWNFTCAQDCRRISFFNISFPRFPREIFLSNPEVHEIYLESAQLEKLEFGDFSNTTQLNWLGIYDNPKLTSIGENTFWGAYELRHIDISRNNIDDIPNGAFNGLPNLELVHLKSNNLTKIEKDVFRPLPALRYVSLKGNSLESVYEETFTDNLHLQELDLSYNQLEMIDILLANLEMEYFNFNFNKLTWISVRSYSLAPNEPRGRIEVHAHSNQLKRVYFQPNFPIKLLELSGNPIQYLYDLPLVLTVSSIVFENCNMESLDDLIKLNDRFGNLKTIMLGGNNITTFNKTLDGSPVETLSLRNNGIEELDFPVLKSVYSLDLSDNKLTEFPYGDNVRATFPSLKMINLANNSFETAYITDLVNKLQEQGVVVHV